jgi:hypothetical protein
MSKTQKPIGNKGGRPPVDTEALTLRLSRAMIETIDDYRRALADLPSRPEAVRRLLATAIKGLK